MDKLYVVTRDGKSVGEFLTFNNLTNDNIKVVKKVSDLDNAEGKRYVVLPPLPLAYHYAIRPVLHKLHMINVTKKYKLSDD